MDMGDHAQDQIEQPDIPFANDVKRGRFRPFKGHRAAEFQSDTGFDLHFGPVVTVALPRQFFPTRGLSQTPVHRSICGKESQGRGSLVSLTPERLHPGRLLCDPQFAQQSMPTANGFSPYRITH
jgi:hypothetical protein